MNLKRRLLVLAKWLEQADDNIDSYRDGDMERAVKYAVQDVQQKIGSQLREVLEMTDKQIKNEEDE